jgi:hypothetical protein
MREIVTVGLSRLAVEALEGEEGDAAAHVSGRLGRAIRYYLSERGSGRLEWPYPFFMRERGEPGELVSLELNVPAELWGRFESEARRQGTSTRELLEHAAFYMGSDVNSGRITEGILEGFEHEGEVSSGAADEVPTGD